MTLLIPKSQSYTLHCTICDVYTYIHKHIPSGSTTARRSAAPPRPAVTPPSLPRSPDGPPGDCESSGPPHLPSLSLGSVPSLHEVCKVRGCCIPSITLTHVAVICASMCN